MRQHLTRKRRRTGQTGLSLVEMMVGITIGLIVVAAASLMMTNQVMENSRLLLETQLQQDLRAAADLMLRDIRRAGYTSHAETTVWSPLSAAPTSNIYAPTSPRVVDDTQFLYAYAMASGGAGPVPAGKESFGFLLRKVGDGPSAVGVLYAVNGTTFNKDAVPQQFNFASGSAPAWQPLTDPSAVNITSFKVNLVPQPSSAGDYANPPTPCTIGSGSCPCLVVRRVDIEIEAKSVRDPKIVRTLSISSRIRNDQILPSCTVPS